MKVFSIFLKILPTFCDTFVPLYRTILSEEALQCLVKNLTPTIRKLSLFGLDITDDQVEILTSRCNEITELDLRHTPDTPLFTRNYVNSIIRHLQPTLEKLGLSYYKNCGIDFSNVFEMQAHVFDLKSVLQLKHFNCAFHGISDKRNLLKKEIPYLSINDEDFEVAKVF